MAQHTFLVEIGTAELPPKALRSLAEAFADNFKAELTKADLAFGDVEWFASPVHRAASASLGAARASLHSACLPLPHR